MKTLKKSIFTAIVALSCLTIAQAQDGNPQARTEGKLKGKISNTGDTGMISVSDENQENPTAKKGWDGTVKGKKNEAQRKGIRENGLKKNDVDSNMASTGKKGLNAVNVKLSKESSVESSDKTEDANSTPQGHAVRTKGSGATTETEVKPVKVEQIKIGQPHP